MYKRKNIDNNTCVVASVDKRGVIVSQRSFDLQTAKDYVTNTSGFLRSDFAVLNQTNDELEMARVLARMQEVNPEPNPDRPFEEILKSIKPRWCELPNEMDRFEQYCINNSLEYYRKYLPDGDETPDTEDLSAAPAVNE